MKQEQKSSNKNIPLIVLAFIVVAYIALYFINEELFLKSIIIFIKLIIEIAPVLVIVFILMFLNFWFIKPEMIKKYLGKQSGIKGYLFAIIAGIISVGSVYIWYPLLKDLRKSGMTKKLTAVFIYNRSIKLHLLPLMIIYFGLTFTVVLSVLTILFSLVIGYFIQKFDMEGLQ